MGHLYFFICPIYTRTRSLCQAEEMFSSTDLWTVPMNLSFHPDCCVLPEHSGGVKLNKYIPIVAQFRNCGRERTNGYAAGNLIA